MAETSPAAGQARPVPIAPALNNTSEPQDAHEEHMQYACVTCTRRKVKCDKLSPTCSTCRKAKLDCDYQEPAPRKRKRKPQTDDNVHERLEQYEALLKQHGIVPGEVSQSPVSRLGAPATASPVDSPKTSSSMKDLGSRRLLGDQAKTRYIDSNLWQNLGEHDLHPSSDEEDNDDQNESMSRLQLSPSADPVSAALLLGPSSSSPSLLASHPTYEHAMWLWNIYSENIDPLVKVVHLPSGLEMVKRAASNPSSISKATEALLFAIYHFSATVISEKDCQPLFGVEKARLVTIYHDALRQALVNANFLRTTDIKLLQAYILFLLSVRNTYDPHTFWILTGVASRIGQRMGLHRDGQELGLRPFATQMRRRLFWQLLPLDGLASQISGTGMHMALATESWTTEQPWNINDSDIWPDMTQTPESRVGATDIIFVRARTELVKFIQNSRPPLPVFGPPTKVWDFKHTATWERQLDELEAMMETKYLRYCDFANPLHNIVAVMARTAANSGRFRIRFSHAKALGELTAEERDYLWTLARKIIDYDIASQQNYNLARFFWHLEAYFQWDPLIWILTEITREPHSPQSEGIWERLEKVYTNHPNMTTQRRALHIALGQLTLRAWDARRATQTPGQQMSEPEPLFISTLRTFTSKRGSSRGSSAVPAAVEYNPFDPTQDASEDLGSFNMPAGDMQWNTGLYDANAYLGDFKADSMDWIFWEQLVRNPNVFPQAAT